MTTTSKTTPEALLPSGCISLAVNYIRDSRWQATRWDGLFTAPCPCGQLTTWDAHQKMPLCVGKACDGSA